MTTEERLAKYPTSHYDPKPDCKSCHGKGERSITMPSDGRVVVSCCICIFVDHEFSEDMGKQIGAIAKKELSKLRAS